MRRTLWRGLLVVGLGLGLSLSTPAGAVDCLSHKFTNPKADGVDTSVVRPSDWNACHNVSGGTDGQVLKRDTGATDGWSWVNQPDIYGPSYLVLTNKTGGALAANDLVALDTSNDSAAALGDTASSLQAFVVAAESVSNNVAGKFYRQGLVTIKVTGAVTRGRYLVKSATTLAAQDSGTLMTATNVRPAGTFAVATTAAAGPGAGTVTAYLFGTTAPSGLGTTGSFDLPTNAAVLPDATGTINNPPEPIRRVSSGTQTTNSPKATQLVWSMDAGTDEHVLWTRLMPADYASGGTFRIAFTMASATSGTVVLKCGVAPILDGTTNATTLVFNTVGQSAATTVPGTAGIIKVTTCAPTLTSLAANVPTVFFVGRDADDGSDGATGDLRLEAVSFEFTR